MRVLVTGAQGCIGAWAVKQLLEKQVDVIAYDQETEPARLRLIAGEDEIAKVRFVQGAIEDTPRVKALVRDEQITHILHLAAVLMPFCQAEPVRGGMINVIGTLNVFEAARDAGRPVRVAYASSSAVWGPSEAYDAGQLLNEEDPLKPSSHYGVFKQANEGSARAFFLSNGISSIGLRPWTVYGVGRDRGLTADPTLAMQAVVLGQPFQIRLSGYMDLQYVEDVAATFLRCLFADITGAEVFNLRGDIVAIEQIIETIAEHRPAARDLLSAKGPQVPVAYRMDDARLRKMVPGIPGTSLHQGVEMTLTRFEELHRAGRLPLL